MKKQKRLTGKITDFKPHCNFGEIKKKKKIERLPMYNKDIQNKKLLNVQI